MTCACCRVLPVAQAVRDKNQPPPREADLAVQAVQSVGHAAHSSRGVQTRSKGVGGQAHGRYEGEQCGVRRKADEKDGGVVAAAHARPMCMQARWHGAGPWGWGAGPRPAPRITCPICLAVAWGGAMGMMRGRSYTGEDRTTSMNISATADRLGRN